MGGAAGNGDWGMLGVAVISPFMISCIDASRASTRVDICPIRSRICDDISSNLISSCSNKVSTNAVNSWGLEISPGLRGPADGVGVLSLVGPVIDVGFAGVEAGVTLRGSADDGGI